MYAIVLLLLMSIVVEGRRNTRAWDKMYKEKEGKCRNSEECPRVTASSKESERIANNNCVRKCVSPSCYHQYYVAYNFEEGEVDFRESQFKTCAAKELREAKNADKNV